MSKVLVVGKRGRCYRAAIKLDHETFLWSDEAFHESRKKRLAGWIEFPFGECQAEIPENLLTQISTWNIDYVIAATESSVNIAATLRDIFQLPGTPLRISNLLHNKLEMKKVAREHDIPITPFRLVEDRSPSQLVDELGLPLVVKPLAESGARGVMVLQTLEDVAAHAHPDLLAEAFVEGNEVSVETLIQNGKPIFHNITDYLHQWRKSILPTVLDQDLVHRIQLINDRALEVFEVENGMTHAEFYLTKNGPLFGEMAIRPPGGYYMELIEQAYAFDPWETFVRLESGQTTSQLPTTAAEFAAVYMIHPGPGTIRKISGVDEVRSLDSVLTFDIRVEVGDSVGERQSTSSECGHILLHHESRPALLDHIEFIETTLHIEME